MPRYRVYVSTEAVITEAWEVDADSAEEAGQEVLAGNAEFVDQTDVDSEHDRTVEVVEEIEP